MSEQTEPGPVNAPAPIRAGPLIIRGRRFDWGVRTYVMAIINVTPDSFSGDGVGRDQGEVARLTRMAVAGGADIIDLGGESTRPGAAAIAAGEELERVLPALVTIRSLTDLPVSVDTFKAAVAAAALAAGADIVNDVSGLQGDPRMAEVVARSGCPVVLTHNRSARPSGGAIGGHYTEVVYDDVVSDIRRDLGDRLKTATEAGIDCAKIILDPGVGFGKTPAQNLELLGRLGELQELGRPLLLGVSRKSFIGYALGDGKADRTWGTAAANVIGIAQGVDIIRVHDVAPMVQAARTADAILRRPPN